MCYALTILSTISLSWRILNEKHDVGYKQLTLLKESVGTSITITILTKHASKDHKLMNVNQVVQKQISYIQAAKPIEKNKKRSKSLDLQELNQQIPENSNSPMMLNLQRHFCLPKESRHVIPSLHKYITNSYAQMIISWQALDGI